jgi:hypothetical protein
MPDHRLTVATERDVHRFSGSDPGKALLRKIPKNAKISTSAPEQLRQGIRSPVAQW